MAHASKCIKNYEGYLGMVLILKHIDDIINMLALYIIVYVHVHTCLTLVVYAFHNIYLVWFSGFELINLISYTFVQLLKQQLSNLNSGS